MRVRNEFNLRGLASVVLPIEPVDKLARMNAAWDGLHYVDAVVVLIGQVLCRGSI
jgi:hypothetical protein